MVININSTVRVTLILIIVWVFYSIAPVKAGTSAISNEENKDSWFEYAIKGKFKESKEYVEKALSIKPDSDLLKERLIVLNDVIENKIMTATAIHIFKGISYYFDRKLEPALLELNEAVEINPAYGVPYEYRSLIYMEKGQLDLAISDYSKLIEIKPKDAELYFGRGMLYKGKNLWDKAISNFNKAIGINPTHTNAYFYRADSYSSKGDKKSAINDYTRHIEIKPNEWEPYYNRGIMYFTSGQKAKGCSDLKKTCELGKCSPYNTLRQQGECKGKSWREFWK